MTEFVGRLVPMQLGSPTLNMAIDQTLLESIDQGGRATLRLYRWDRPTLSLGYFQPKVDRELHAESRDLVCIRRATGGGAIVHDHELTYSVAVPIADARAGARNELYQQLHLAIAQVLADFGICAVPHRLTSAPRVAAMNQPSDPQVAGQPEPFLCFQRRTPEDLVVAGYKVLGSAQRRSRKGVLQHGSLLLQASRSAPQLPGVRELSSRAVPIEQLSDDLLIRFAAVLGLERWHVEPLSKAEHERAGQIAVNRYGDQRWLDRR